MARGNRFYRPPTIEYQSQFVPTQYPYEQLMDLEKFKIQRAETSLENLGQIDALRGAITAGYRTRDITPAVKDYWSNKISKFVDENTDLASPKTLRNLSRLKAEFINDPNIKLIQQDYASGNPEYDAMRRSKTFNLDVNRNIDPRTGDIKQFGLAAPIEGIDLPTGQSYQPYDPLTYYQDYEAEALQRLNMVKPTRNKVTKMVSAEDPTLGTPVRKTISGSILRLGKEEFNEPIKELAQDILEGDTHYAAYMKEKLGDKVPWTQEGIENWLHGISRPLYRTEDLTSDTYSPYSAAELKLLGQQAAPTAWTAAYPQPSTKFSPDKNLKDVSAIDKVGYYLVKEGQKKLFGPEDKRPRFDLSDAANIVTHREGEAGAIAKANKTRLYRAAIEDPEGAKYAVEKWYKDKMEYYSARHNITEGIGKARYEGYKQHMRDDLDYLDRIANRFYKNVAITTDEEYDNFYARLKMENEVLPEMDKDDSFAGRLEKKQFLRNKMAEKLSMPVRAKFAVLDPDTVKDMNVMIGGSFVQNGRVTAKQARSEILNGARLFDPKNPDAEFKTSRRENLLQDDSAFTVKGIIKPEDSVWGPNILILDTPEGTVFMEFNPDYTELLNLPYVLGDNEKQWNGYGHPFALLGINNGIIDIATEWNQTYKDIPGNAPWFNTIIDYNEMISNVEDKKPYVLRGYDGHPDDPNTKAHTLLRSAEPITPQDFIEYAGDWADEYTQKILSQYGEEKTVAGTK